MQNFFNEPLTDKQLNTISVLGLAYIGDSVFELLVRSYYCKMGIVRNDLLHNSTVSMVAAPAQAKAIEKLMPYLCDEEIAVYKRGRNCRVNSVPHGASNKEYHCATGLEALFGWLYLKGNNDRLSYLFNIIMGDISDAY